MLIDKSTTSELFVLTYEEHFLPFDMDAASTSTISLLIAAAIDSSLLRDHSPWSQRAHKILDQMVQRGNHAAKLVQSELKQLDGELAQLAMKEGVETALTREAYHQSTGLGQFVEAVPLVTGSEQSPLEVELDEGFGQHYELSPNQMMDLANSLDLNSLSWPLSSIHDMSGLGI